MATIKDIAKITGLSSASVSYALNGRANISEDTRKRVLEVAKKVNYSPVRTIAPADKKVKSLAFVSCLPFDPWGETYWGQLLNGCLEASHQTDSVLQVAQIDPEKTFDEQQLPVLLRERMADGLIITGWPDKALLDKLSEKKIPTVLLDTRDMFDGFHHVRPDHYGGVFKAVNHLHELGHNRIAVISGDFDFACEKVRHFAYELAMSNLGLKWEDSWIIKQPHLCEDSGYEGMKNIIENKLDVTAVICHGDLIARGAMRTIKEYGLSVPDDFSIIGIDNQPFSETITPSLTTIDVSLIELGQAAVMHLMEVIKNNKMSPRKITIEAKLIARESTDQVKLYKITLPKFETDVPKQ